jgi:hypothetical protein
MPIEIPPEFLCVRYDSDRRPRTAEFNLSKGANCQLWAYALLNHFGIEVPPFRSSDLWEDTEFSDAVHRLQPLDLLLFNQTESSWGAHVAVYLGDDAVAHLSRKIGLPAVCTLEEMLRTPTYQVLVGAKRIRRKVPGRLAVGPAAP